MKVISVNVGLPERAEFRTTSLPETAIEKLPVEGRVRITSYGVDGNACASTDVHGDEFMRVYAYAAEDYRWWEGQLGLGADDALRPGLFGEQLTTEGLDLNASLLGEIWRVGTAVLQIAHVRIPCQTFKGWMGHRGYDATAWLRRFALAARPGPYFRVLEEGSVAAGDPIEVLDRPAHEVSVATMFRALMNNPELLPGLLTVEGLKPWVYEHARAHVVASPDPS